MLVDSPDVTTVFTVSRAALEGWTSRIWVVHVKVGGNRDGARANRSPRRLVLLARAD